VEKIAAAVIVVVVEIVTAAAVPVAVAEVVLAEVGIIWEMEKRKEDDHKEEKKCKRMKEGGHSLRMRRMEENMQIRRRKRIK
jgi:hypothetical protein